MSQPQTPRQQGWSDDILEEVQRRTAVPTHVKFRADPIQPPEETLDFGEETGIPFEAEPEDADSDLETTMAKEEARQPGLLHRGQPFETAKLRAERSLKARGIDDSQFLYISERVYAQICTELGLTPGVTVKNHIDQLRDDIHSTLGADIRQQHVSNEGFKARFTQAERRLDTVELHLKGVEAAVKELRKNLSDNMTLIHDSLVTGTNIMRYSRANWMLNPQIPRRLPVL